MMVKVTDFAIVGPYTLRITFDDGTEQTINFEPVLYGYYYAPLRDLDFFRQVRLDAEVATLVWPNDADFDPATLYDWHRGDGTELAQKVVRWHGLRQTVTPAKESPGLASDPPKSRSPRAGWRFTCAEGLRLAPCAARSPKRCFALIPKWEYNLVTDQYDRLSSTRIMRRLRAA